MRLGMSLPVQGTMRKLLLIFATLPAVLSPALAAPYEGRWAERAAWCRNRSGSDEMPITISRRAIASFASSCQVQSIKRRGAAWWLRTLCRDEGQDDSTPPTSNIVVLRVDGDKLAMRDSAGIRNLTRCHR